MDIVKANFPITEDAFNQADIGVDSLTYSTTLSVEEVMKYYRNEYMAKGYAERKELRTVSGDSFRIVFKGDLSSQAAVTQSEDLGGGSRTVTMWLEDV